VQTTLFGRLAPPSFDADFAGTERIVLDDHGAWIDRVQGWIAGHEALFDELRERMTWHAQRRVMYDSVVDVPRLLAGVPADGDPPILRAMAEALSRRYGYRFAHVSLALYRGGDDSVAWHRDKGIRDWPHGCVAVASLGGTRRFQVRPLGGGSARTVSTGWGDLLVMGGSMQRRWEHAIPKAAHAEPRMALMFRHGDPRGSSRTTASGSPRG